MARTVYSWQHDDNLSFRIGFALMRCRAQGWFNSAHLPEGLPGIADFRCILADSAVKAALLSRSPSVDQDITVRLDKVRLSGERRDAADAAIGTFSLFARTSGYPAGSFPANVSTSVDGAPQPGGAPDAGAAPAIVVVGIIAAAAVVAYAAHEAAAIIDRDLDRTAILDDRQNARATVANAMMVTQAELLDRLDAHQAREFDAKHALPFDNATKLAVRELRAQQAGFLGVLKAQGAMRPSAPLPKPFGGGFLSGLGAGALLVGAAGVYLLTRTGKEA